MHFLIVIINLISANMQPQSNHLPIICQHAQTHLKTFKPLKKWQKELSAQIL